MKRTIRLTESDLKRVIKESVKKILKEDYRNFDGFDNDLDYNSIYEQTLEYLQKNTQTGRTWREIAQDLGFRLETIGPNDMETLKDAIQDAMIDTFKADNVLNNELEECVKRSLKESLYKKTMIFEKKSDEKLNKRRAVLEWLRHPEVNCAEIRRQLEGEPESQEEEDARRSYFMKKVNESDGKRFTDEEINSLYALKSKLGY